MGDVGRSRKRKLLILASVMGMLACAVLGLSGIIRRDLLHDQVEGDSRADRWLPVTWPVLTVCARSAHEGRRDYANRKLLAAPWPFGETWLEERLRRNPLEDFPGDLWRLPFAMPRRSGWLGSSTSTKPCA